MLKSTSTPLIPTMITQELMLLCCILIWNLRRTIVLPQVTGKHRATVQKKIQWEDYLFRGLWMRMRLQVFLPRGSTVGHVGLFVICSSRVFGGSCLNFSMPLCVCVCVCVYVSAVSSSVHNIGCSITHYFCWLHYLFQQLLFSLWYYFRVLISRHSCDIFIVSFLVHYCH